MTSPMLALESGESRRDPSLVTFGVAVLAVSLMVGFGALFGAWLSIRSGTAVWPPQGVRIENYYGTTLSVTMFLGVLAAEWAVYGVRKEEKSQAVGALSLLVVLGLAFLNLLSYVAHVAHFGPATHPYGTVFFAFVILMGASVVTALLLAVLTLARVLGGQVTAGEPGLVRSTAWFWHAVTVGWIVMYAAIFVVN